MPESHKMTETMTEENELLCRKLRVESYFFLIEKTCSTLTVYSRACKKAVTATRRLRSAKLGDPEQNKNFYALKAGEVEIVNDAHDALQEYSKTASGSIDEMLRGRLSQEIRDMIYDHILPPGKVVVGRMHCGAIALREHVSDEWVNIRQYQFLGEDIVSELAICLYRTRTFALDKTSEVNMSTDSDVMTDFLAADVYGTNISPAKFVSRVYVSIGHHCFRPESATRYSLQLSPKDRSHRGMSSCSQLLASLGALKVLQRPSCVLTMDLKATINLVHVQILTPMALRTICPQLGDLISSGWKIRIDLEDYQPVPQHPPSFRNLPNNLKDMFPKGTIPLPQERSPVILTEKDTDKTVRTTEEMIALLEGVGEHLVTAPRERAYWKLWLQTIRPKDDTNQNAGSDTGNVVPAWEIAKTKLEEAMQRVQYT